MNLLEAEGVTKHFGGVAALRDARFALRSGEVHALVGENGAGKSTMAKIIAGSVKPDSARLMLDGRAVSMRGPRDAQQLGIGIIYQELDLFRELTVGENIVIGNLHFRERRLVNWRAIEAFCRPFLDQVALASSVRQMAGSLSIARLQLVAIARALSMNARIILMDEPTSSLFHDDVERLFGVIRELKGRGVSIVYVSHKMDEIFRICDRATVMRDGETIATVEIAATTPEEIVRLMVGRKRGQTHLSERIIASDPFFSVERLSSRKLRDISFELRRGEVLGVAGLVGSGRSSLGAELFGRFRGRLGLVPEDRRTQGLMMSMSVLENGTMAALPRLQALGFVRSKQERREFAATASQMALHCPSLSAPVATLSGGNQQKVLLARWLLVAPDVLFLDDPTRGIDVGAKEDIYRIIDDLAAAGKGVIFVSSELPELLRCCERILVLSNGRLTAVYDAKVATQEKIMAAATNLASASESAG